MNRKICVLSGGAGTRLWPLSREAFPKQFYDLTHSGKPLLINTIARLQSFGKISVVTTETLKFPTIGILKRFESQCDVIGEPAPRNTAPAVALAVSLQMQSDSSAIMGIFPADHFIADLSAFRSAVDAGFNLANDGKVVTLGITPHSPSSAYGYIELSDKIQCDNKKSVTVVKFIEKPPQDQAAQLIATSRVVWNAGIFIFPVTKMAELFATHMPELWNSFKNLKKDGSNWKEPYQAAANQSLDYGIMERLSDIHCIPTAMGWSDVGSWEEVAKKSESLGNPIEIGGSGNFYTGMMPENKRIAFVGVSDVFVIDTPDAVLVCKKGEGQRVKEVVDRFKKESSPLLKAHTFEDRPWGRFEVLSDTAHYKSKKISVWPGQKLSYQSHEKRAEHWIIVRGQAEVTLNDVVHKLKSGDYIYIPLQAKHRIANPSTEALEFIEVQSGTYFGEDDITRYSDDYGRA
jgi:mannose-1-phosphate guanylyltransferase/mannose-6-phosphate isomerase